MLGAIKHIMYIMQFNKRLHTLVIGVNIGDGM